jgi:hypothetical protein
MKQTAVEWLAETLRFASKELYAEMYEHIEQAKQMEKEQIIDTYDAGQLHFWPDEFLQRGEYYYNETFKTNEK